MKVYLIGSLRNPRIPDIAQKLRGLEKELDVLLEVVDDWYAAGPEADDKWQQYEQQKGSSYQDGLKGLHANHVFDFDKHHLDSASIGVLLLPAGRSAHLELGYLIGQGKPCYILFDSQPERWDVMYKFADGVFFEFDDLAGALRKDFRSKVAEED